ncbi:MAG: class I SAM-dependent methyltransferase [Planctomycetota bacterium]|nr:MAG: class I SAM-dependent methyltransferase [Planctomycetota bacterium]
MEQIRPYSHSRTNRKLLKLLTRDDISNIRLVDVGAGEGYFLQELGEHLKNNYALSPSKLLRACDLYPENFKYKEVPCDRVNANGDLPYKDNEFNLVSSIEVIEHIEDHFHLARELYRITRPGGKVFITTPNVLNINSRIRFMYSGFAELFYPVPLSSADPVHKGHIHPVSFYYLAYILNRAGFRDIKLHFDRRKKSATALLILFYLPILLGHAWFRLRMKGRNRAIYMENKRVLTRINSLNMLICRTLIIEGTK